MFNNNKYLIEAASYSLRVRWVPAGSLVCPWDCHGGGTCTEVLDQPTCVCHNGVGQPTCTRHHGNYIYDALSLGIHLGFVFFLHRQQCHRGSRYTEVAGQPIGICYNSMEALIFATRSACCWGFCAQLALFWCWASLCLSQLACHCLNLQFVWPAGFCSCGILCRYQCCNAGTTPVAPITIIQLKSLLWLVSLPTRAFPGNTMHESSAHLSRQPLRRAKEAANAFTQVLRQPIHICNNDSQIDTACRCDGIFLT